MTVHLVGAGPGDPELVTVRGLARIRACDVLIHDALVDAGLVAEAPPHALVIDRTGRSQDDVTELLVRYGALGLDVVRLKGGDPFVFGRGGEELLALEAAGIEVEVVPGLSSIAAVPAAAGIPITHRGLADRVTFATAHAEDGSEPDYDALVAGGGTLVLFMGLGRAAAIADGLVTAGLAGSTPAAIVARGTLPDQQVACGRLEELGSLASGLGSPALIVVGEVAAFADVEALARLAVA
ncbi:MAG: uroporphyrinogen-III C-methyltransferase [Gaiellales bacterium]